LKLDWCEATGAAGLVAVVARAARSLLGEALAAVDRLAGRGPEGDLSLLAAAAANSSVHLTRAGGVASATTAAAVSATAVAAVVVPLRLACGAAARAALRFGVTALKIEGLLALCENKFLAAIAAGQASVAHSANFPCRQARPDGVIQTEFLPIQTAQAERDPSDLWRSRSSGACAREQRLKSMIVPYLTADNLTKP